MRQRALSILRRLFVGMGLGAGSFIILLLIFGSPSEKELRIAVSYTHLDVYKRQARDKMMNSHRGFGGPGFGPGPGRHGRRPF